MASNALSQDAVDYEGAVREVLSERCVHCHNSDEPKADLDDRNALDLLLLTDLAYRRAHERDERSQQVSEESSSDLDAAGLANLLERLGRFD